MPNKSASSAKSLTVDCKYFFYIQYNGGPRTVPCGTPDVTIMGFDRLPSQITDWVRPIRNDSSHLSKFSRIPQYSSLQRRRGCGTLSKALLKSSMAAWTDLLSCKVFARTLEAIQVSKLHTRLHISTWMVEYQNRLRLGKQLLKQIQSRGHTLSGTRGDLIRPTCFVWFQ